MIKAIQKIFGTKSDKDVKLIRPLVDEINAAYATLADLTDEQLRAKTDEYRARISAAVAPLVEEAEAINARLRSDEDIEHGERSDLYARLTQNDREQFQTIQDELDALLPEAFAVVKDACRRLQGLQYLIVGREARWDMLPYDVQLIGGIVLHQGKISEMATGEGKTLVATLPLYLNSLAGRGVHLVTVNDYLAKRDREWMKPIFDMLGVVTGCIQSNMEPSARKQEYAADITYGTNNEFGFDYLRDNMVQESAQMVQRPHWFAIVDEVDSVLIDEARTPLIISGPVSAGSTEQAFVDMNPRVRRLVEVQSRFVNGIVAEAEQLLEKGGKENIAQAGVNILRANRGMPKHSRLFKLLQNPDNAKLLRDTELEYLKEQGQRMQIIDQELFFSVDERNHSIDTSDKGRELLCNAQEDPNMFLIPDVATEIAVIENDPTTTPEEKTLLRDALYLTFSERSDRIHIANQLLRAYTLYARDDEYVVQDAKIKIVDEFTGRILEGRRYSDGLHQAIEAKEGVTVEQDTQTFATVTLQNYFRLYHKLAGMTGTAETEAAEFWEIYKLDVVVIPTNRPNIRKDDDDLIYRTKREKYNAVVESTRKHIDEGRAVLVGTTSVEVSELLSKMLKRAGIQHNVLNAKQHQREAEIVATAGMTNAVTIATNMAGRGTDIKLDPKVKESGGLVIIGTERHEARRIDRQLRGRSGRQGDPGFTQFFISLEDDLMRLFRGDRIASVMTRLKVPDGEPIQSPLVTKSVENAQKKVESNNFSTRKRLLEYDNVMNQQREVVYDRRRHALSGERLKSEVYDYVNELAEDWYDEFHESGDIAGFRNAVRATLLCDPTFSDQEFKGLSKEAVVENVAAAAFEYYERKESMFGSEFMGRLERFAVLQSIDEAWREHLRAMDELKEGIYLRAYGQKDPLLEYKGEAYKVFIDLIREIDKQTVGFAFKYFPQGQQPTRRQGDGATRRQGDGATGRQGDGATGRQGDGATGRQGDGATGRQGDGATGRQGEAATPAAAVDASLPRQKSVVSSMKQLQFTHATPTHVYGGSEEDGGGRPAAAVTARNTGTEVGRNELCPCGSGRKFKNCHGASGDTRYHG